MSSQYKTSVTVGIDIGTADSIIAYVGKAMVDIVQNEVSQRKTPTVVGFNDRERLLGDAAQVVMKSNMKNTVRNFRHIVGAMEQVGDRLQKEKFWSLSPTEQAEDGSCGFSVMYKGEKVTYSATQILAMYLTKMKETAENWCQARVVDVVLSVPSYFTDFQRQAMLDAANVAGLNCLRLMNEHTATALAYGIYRTKEFDAEKPTITAFAHMGHSSCSISIVSFLPSKLSIIAEKTSLECGGRDQDEALMRHFSAEFEKKFGCSPLENKKAQLKLEDACTKCKKVLSANDHAPIGVECLMEDEDLSSSVSREKFEELCAPLKKNLEETIDAVIAEAKENGLENVGDINFVEIIGGASRVPWFQKTLEEKFGKDLSRTLNADECVARGCALQAAILSPSYKVRDFKVEDRVPHPITITWMGSAKDAQQTEEGGAEDKEEEVKEKEEAPLQQKSMEVFKSEDKMDQRRHITWFRNNEFDLGAKYSKSGTKLGDYKIALPQSEEKKKIKIEAKMSIHGIFKLESAHIVEQETYEEIVKEKREVKDEDGDEPMPDAEKKEGEGEGEKKKPKYEWVDVKKPKSRTKRTPLDIISKNTSALPDDLMARYKDVESRLITETREAKENDDRRNELEAYIYAMREKIVNDGGKASEFMKSEEKATFGTALTTAEDWLYDHFDATTLELIDKLGELQSVGNPVLKRQQDRDDAKEFLGKFLSTLTDIRALANNPSEDYAHIDLEKRNQLAAKATELESWANAEMAKNDATEPFSDDLPLKATTLKEKEAEIKKECTKIMSEPKPAPEAPKMPEGTVVPPTEEGAKEEGTGTASEGEHKATEDDAGMEGKEQGEGEGVEEKMPKEGGEAAADSMQVD